VVVLTWLLLHSGQSEQLAVLLEDWRPVLAEVVVSPEGPEALRAAAHYLYRVGAEGALEALWRVLDSVAREQRAEEKMRGFFTVPALEEARVKGLAQGRAEAVLEILAEREIAVDEGARQRIMACTDLAILDRWRKKAWKAKSLADLEDLERNG